VLGDFISAHREDILARSRLRVAAGNGEGVVAPGESTAAIHEVEIAASMLAHTRGLHFTVTSVDRAVLIDADRQTLAAIDLPRQTIPVVGRA
jgi:hypothetical protein